MCQRVMQPEDIPKNWRTEAEAASTQRVAAASPEATQAEKRDKTLHKGFTTLTDEFLYDDTRVVRT